MNTTRIALFGATGFSGGPVLTELLRRGHHVRALVRNPGAFERPQNASGLEVVQGNALDPDDVGACLKDTDVVVHCLGVGGQGDGKHTTLVSKSVELVTEQMRGLEMRRIVCMSNLGVDGTGPWVANRVVVPLFFRWLLPIIEDKVRMERHLGETNLDWVAVRWPNIVEGAARPLRISPDGRGVSLKVTTQSVAEHIADLAVAPRIAHRTPAVSN